MIETHARRDSLRHTGSGPVWLARVAGSPTGQRAALVACGPLAAYLALRHPVGAAFAVALLGTIGVGLVRPDLLALALVPIGMLVDVYHFGGPVLLGGVVALAVGVALTRVIGRTGPRWAWPHLAIGALAVLLLASLTVHTMPGSRGVSLDFLYLIAGLVIVVAVSIAPPRMETLTATIVLTGTAAAGYLLLLGDYSGGRLTGLGAGTNYIGALLAFPIAAGVARARHSRHLAAAGWLTASLLCAAALFRTYSRGGLVAAAAGVAVALLADRPLRRQLYLAAAGAIGYLVLANVHPALREMLLGSRSTAELSTNNAIRAAAARVALDVVVQHPLRGVGYGLFAYVAQLDPRLHTFINTHNDYLRLAAETGVLSTVLLVAVLGAAFFAGTGSARLPIRAAVAAGAVTLAFANTLSSPIVSSGFWVCLGCLLASRERRSSRPR